MNVDFVAAVVSRRPTIQIQNVMVDGRQPSAVACGLWLMIFSFPTFEAKKALVPTDRPSSGPR
jgi:hypothetical protein